MPDGRGRCKPNRTGAPPGFGRLRHAGPSSHTSPSTGTYSEEVHRIFTTSVASVYPHYVAKVERKGRSKAELDEAIRWLTGFSQAELEAHLDAGTTFADFFDAAELTPQASLITGTVCGIRVEEVEDPLMRRIRYLDKLVDELAKGKALEKVLRQPADRG